MVRIIRGSTHEVNKEIMSIQSYMRFRGLILLLLPEKQRGATAFEVFNLDTLTKFKGLVGVISDDIIPIIRKMGMGIIILFF